jgi:integrase
VAKQGIVRKADLRRVIDILQERGVPLGALELLPGGEVRLHLAAPGAVMASSLDKEVLSWDEADIAQFEAYWAVGTRERLAFDLLLYTAQRSGDVRQMGRQQIRDDAILVRQEKTKAFLELPIHPSLRPSLQTVPTGQMLFLTTKSGAGFTAGGFGNWFRDAARAAGIENRSAHGLRKSAATRLADAGCTEAQIKAVTGHTTSKEVERYTKARDQKRLAKDAFALIGGTQREQILANPVSELAKKVNN